MALTILVCTGLTVDLRYFDFPILVTFLIAGVAVGWADRAAQGPAAVEATPRIGSVAHHV